MGINDIFTEYNSKLINQIDRDPLGFQQIWTHFGQKIFESKTTSVATDIRNYTINLIHHNVIRQLPEKCPIFWNTISQKSYKEGIEKSIILLEMMLAHSRVVSGEEWIESKGILGVSMAFKRWQNSSDVVNLESSLSDPRWDSNPKSKSFEMLLVRQTSLGINGRYKGPFMKMGLFQSDYKYANYSDQWEKIDEAINGNQTLKELQEILFISLNGLNKKEVVFSTSSLWCKAYENAFKTHEITADFASKFWPKYLGFETGAAKAIFDILIEDNPCKNELTIEQILKKAKRKISLSDVYEIKAIQDILDLEPILAQLDAIFQLLLKTQDLEVNITNNIINMVKIYKIPNGSPTRLKNLIELITTSKNIPIALLKYHEKVMNERGNMPWMKILENDDLKIYLQSDIGNSIEDLKKRLDSKNTSWIHPYYIPSMKEIVCGMTTSNK